MRSVWKVRSLGLGFILAAVPVYVAVSEPVGGVLAAALAVVGAFVAVVVAEPTTPAAAAAAILAGDARALEATARGLRLQGAAVYVHDQGNVGEERLFLSPSPTLKRVPVLDLDTAAYAGEGGTMSGFAIPPPGLVLLNRYCRDADVELKGAGVPEVEAALRGLYEAHDLARGAQLTEAGGSLELRLRAGTVPPPCLADPAAPLCASTGCALCQAAGCALARSFERPLAVESAEVSAPLVKIRFRPAEELV